MSLFSWTHLEFTWRDSERIKILKQNHWSLYLRGVQMKIIFKITWMREEFYMKAPCSVGGEVRYPKLLTTYKIFTIPNCQELIEAKNWIRLLWCFISRVLWRREGLGKRIQYLEWNMNVLIRKSIKCHINKVNVSPLCREIQNNNIFQFVESISIQDHGVFFVSWYRLWVKVALLKI